MSSIKTTRARWAKSSSHQVWQECLMERERPISVWVLFVFLCVPFARVFFLYRLWVLWKCSVLFQWINWICVLFAFVCFVCLWICLCDFWVRVRCSSEWVNISFSLLFVFFASTRDLIVCTGCIDAGEKWLERNLIPVAGVAVGVALMQVHFWSIWSGNNCSNYNWFEDKSREDRPLVQIFLSRSSSTGGKVVNRTSFVCMAMHPKVYFTSFNYYYISLNSHWNFYSLAIRFWEFVLPKTFEVTFSPKWPNGDDQGWRVKRSSGTRLSSKNKTTNCIQLLYFARDLVTKGGLKVELF